MKVVPLSEAKAKFSRILNIVERTGKSVTITRNRKAVAVIMSKNKYHGWRETLEILSDAEFMKEIRAGIRAARRTNTRVTIHELFAEKGKK